MRNVKYNNKETEDDIKYAFIYNSLEKRLGDIDVIVAEVCGENDGVDWYWILQMKDNTFSWARGGCDYTGWDCQSDAEIHDNFKTPEEAIENIKIEYDNRKIKECLLGQINDKPFALYEV